MASANNPLTGRDDGKISPPKIMPGMNKLPPKGTSIGGRDESGAERIELSDSETDKLLAKVRKRFVMCSEAEDENRKAGLEDKKFVAGDQWSSGDLKKRATAQRPALTINRMGTFVRQVTNNIRQNRPQIKVAPMGDGGDRKVALMYSGLIRAIERDCAADIAYDTAAGDAASMGWGYFRFDTEYETPDSFNQVLVIRRVRNAFTVYMDPNHQEPDGSDSKFQFVTELVPKDEFEDEYPDASPMNFQLTGLGEGYKDWGDGKNVRIAEYFELNMKSRALVALDNGHVGWEDELDDIVKRKISTGKIEVVNRRESPSREVRWFKVSALDILDSRVWPSQFLPIVKVIGNEDDIEGKVKYSGVVRHAKDSQRIYNFAKTSETESVMLVPKAKWLTEEGQIEDFGDEWREAHNDPSPVLRYKAVGLGDQMVAPPTLIAPPGIDAGLQAVISGAAMDMMATTGIQFDANQQELRKDASGKAVRELSRNTDTGSFHYMDNFTRSLRHAGRIFVDMIPRIYDTKRVVVLLREDDTEQQAVMDPNASQPQQKGPHPQKQNVTLDIYNPTIGRYGVTITTGPSFATKRIEAAEQMLEFVKALPHTANVLPDLIAKNLDFPGAEEMANRLKMTLPPQLLQPDIQGLPPQAQALVQNMSNQIKQLVAQRTQMMTALKDKSGDRQVKLEKIDKDFQAKLLGLLQKAEQTHKSHALDVAHYISPPGGVNPGDTGAQSGDILGEETQ